MLATVVQLPLDEKEAALVKSALENKCYVSYDPVSTHTSLFLEVTVVKCAKAAKPSIWEVH